MNTSTLWRSTLAILLFGLVSSAPVMAAADKDVNVINTPSVTVTNAPDVNVQSLPPVQIDSPARIPYQVSIQGDTTTAGSNLTIPVPAGYLLVIEYVSCSIFMHPEVELGSFSLYTHVPGTTGSNINYISLPEVAPDFTGSRTYVGGQALRLYADQSFTARFIRVAVGPNASFTMGSARVTVSGYLLPLDTTTLSP